MEKDDLYLTLSLVTCVVTGIIMTITWFPYILQETTPLPSYIETILSIIFVIGTLVAAEFFYLSHIYNYKKEKEQFEWIKAKIFAIIFGGILTALGWLLVTAFSMLVYIPLVTAFIMLVYIPIIEFDSIKEFTTTHTIGIILSVLVGIIVVAYFTINRIVAIKILGKKKVG